MHRYSSATEALLITEVTLDTYAEMFTANMVTHGHKLGSIVGTTFCGDRFKQFTLVDTLAL